MTLEAIITGHGGMEFWPSHHIFTVNNDRYNVSFMAPLDSYGCARNVREGVEPNAHGAWWFGAYLSAGLGVLCGTFTLHPFLAFLTPGVWVLTTQAATAGATDGMCGRGLLTSPGAYAQAPTPSRTMRWNMLPTARGG